MNLAEALDLIEGTGLGTIVSCLPGKLAWVYAEGRNENAVLCRSDKF